MGKEIHIKETSTGTWISADSYISIMEGNLRRTKIPLPDYFYPKPDPANPQTIESVPVKHTTRRRYRRDNFIW